MEKLVILQVLIAVLMVLSAWTQWQFMKIQSKMRQAETNFRYLSDQYDHFFKMHIDYIAKCNDYAKILGEESSTYTVEHAKHLWDKKNAIIFPRLFD